MIQIKGLHIAYGAQKVFTDFSLTIPSGDAVLLKWPSGAGKTTLLKLLMGFEHPDQGQIFIDGLELNKKNKYAIRQKIGYVSQDADLPEGSVHHLFEMSFSLQANSHLQPSQRDVEAYLERYGLTGDILQKQVKDLSGGERQRIGFILCRLLKRSVWLLDEITAGLDYDLREKVVEDVKSSGATCLIVSHDPIWQASNLKEVER